MTRTRDDGPADPTAGRERLAAMAGRGDFGLLLSIWRERGGGPSSVPTRTALLPETLPPHLLPSMSVYDRVGGRFRCRLHGTGMRRVFGYDGTWRFLDEMIPAGMLPGRVAALEACLDGPAPVVMWARAVAPADDAAFAARLLLPVRSAEGGPADLVMGLFRSADASEAPAGSADATAPDLVAWTALDGRAPGPESPGGS